MSRSSLSTGGNEIFLEAADQIRSRRSHLCRIRCYVYGFLLSALIPHLFDCTDFCKKKKKTLKTTIT